MDPSERIPSAGDANHPSSDEAAAAAASDEPEECPWAFINAAVKSRPTRYIINCSLEADIDDTVPVADAAAAVGVSERASNVAEAGVMLAVTLAKIATSGMCNVAVQSEAAEDWRTALMAATDKTNAAVAASKEAVEETPAQGHADSVVTGNAAATSDTTAAGIS